MKTLRSAYRITSIDFLRGLVMIIMALDHTRDYFYIEGMTADPLNLSSTTTALFFTRWITHFCAPVFVFLAGTSAWLQGSRKSKAELSSFLIKRGLWLVVIEIVVMTFILSFDIFYHTILLQTIWAIGISMVVLGLLIWLPFPVILAIGLIILLGHNYLDTLEADPAFKPGLFYQLLHRPAFFPVTKSITIGALYPFLPWIGIMILGYCFGKLVSSTPPEKRTKVFLITGGLVTLFFIILRASNLYGNPQPWTTQSTSWFTLLSFLNTQKYPPSLLYAAMTLGPAIMLLGLMNNIHGRFAKIVTVYGEVPFFYYILHFLVIHLVSSICFLLRGHTFAQGLDNGIPGFPFRFVMPGEGFSLGVTYLIWISIVASLYPLCKWYSNYKKAHQHWWLSYL